MSFDDDAYTLNELISKVHQMYGSDFDVSLHDYENGYIEVVLKKHGVKDTTKDTTKYGRYHPHFKPYFFLQSTYDYTLEQKKACKDKKLPLKCVPYQNGFYDLYNYASYATLEEWYADVATHVFTDKSVVPDMISEIKFGGTDTYTSYMSLTKLQGILEKTLLSLEEHPEPEFDSFDTIVEGIKTNLPKYEGGRYTLYKRNKYNFCIFDHIHNTIYKETLQSTTYNQKVNLQKDKTSPIYRYSFPWFTADGFYGYCCKLSDMPGNITFKQIYFEVNDTAHFKTTHICLHDVLTMSAK